MNRLDKFNALKDNAFYGKMIAKLSNNEFEIAQHFITKYISLSEDDYALKCNRLFLDDSSKPKNWLKICDIVTACK